MSNLEIWNKLKTPPKTALKKIVGGRLTGMTDIKPQWRYEAMTEMFGPCGVGWKYTIDKKEVIQGSEDQFMCFVDVSLYFKHNGEWSDAIPGTGGSMLVSKESKGLHSSDEGFKMATTDALSVAMKLLGMGSEVYMGNVSDSKYPTQEAPAENANKNIFEEDIKTKLSNCKSEKNLTYLWGTLSKADQLKYKDYFTARKNDFKMSEA